MWASFWGVAHDAQLAKENRTAQQVTHNGNSRASQGSQTTMDSIQ